MLNLTWMVTPAASMLNLSPSCKSSTKVGPQHSAVVAEALLSMLEISVISILF